MPPPQTKLNPTRSNLEIEAKSILVPPAEISDENLVEQVKQGDIKAYGGIMRRYNQRMYRVARSVVKNDADALDIVQEAHIKAFRKMENYRGESPLSIWLAAITRNEALMHLRKYKREIPMPDDEIGVVNIAHWQDKPSATSPSPESCLENKELRGLINHVVDQLPVDFRSVFVLREIEQMSIKETAEILDIKPQTVKTRLFRAKGLLRTQIQATLEQAGLRAYEVGGDHCDAIVQNVLSRLILVQL
ncbi:MAG: RNA polymerase sigma factor [Arenicellales bacterium]